MTYRSVWWYPNYVDYAAGVTTSHTLSQVHEQCRRPLASSNLRYYDLPTDRYDERLYYRLPRLALPEYRGVHRDKPHTVAAFYPAGCSQDRPSGFHGRLYYEDGPPQFKYTGPHKDDLYWLEKNPYTPSIPADHPLASKPLGDYAGVKPPTRCTFNSGCCRQNVGSRSDVIGSALSKHQNEPETRWVRTMSGSDYSKRVTLDGVGYL
jgi:hypothetical protein